jgi:hypothetical protein
VEADVHRRSEVAKNAVRGSTAAHLIAMVIVTMSLALIGSCASA